MNLVWQCLRLSLIGLIFPQMLLAGFNQAKIESLASFADDSNTFSTHLPSTPDEPSSTIGEYDVPNFLEAFTKYSPKKVTRRVGRRRHGVNINLFQWPNFNVNGQTQSLCGSEFLPNYGAALHRRPQTKRPPRFMQATSACMMAGVAQEWRRKFCQNNDPSCQLLIGDMSWGASKPGYWPHNGHNRGNCIDIFPIRKPGYKGYTGNVNRSASYDRKRTLELIKLLRKYGGGPNDHQHSNQPIFNDNKIVRAGYTMNRGKHTGHIHVCFKSNHRNKEICENLQFDSKLCPSLAPPSSRPTNGLESFVGS